MTFKRWVLLSSNCRTMSSSRMKSWVDAPILRQQERPGPEGPTHAGVQRCGFRQPVRQTSRRRPTGRPPKRKPYDVYFKMRFNLLPSHAEGRSELPEKHKRVDKLPLFMDVQNFEDFNDWVYKRWTVCWGRWFLHLRPGRCRALRRRTRRYSYRYQSSPLHDAAFRSWCDGLSNNIPAVVPGPTGQ